MKGRFLFMGSGGSLGVPVIGCKCKICQSQNPKNQRMRPSALIKCNNKIFLIDTSPDLRFQALKYGIDRLDGVFITHAHYDHIAGLDELRIFYYKQKKAVPCLLSRDTFEELKFRYYYLIEPGSASHEKGSKLDFQILENDFGQMTFQNFGFHYLSYFQAGMKVTGFRWKDFAYVTDIHTPTDDVISSLKGVDTLVLSALRWEKSPVHFGIQEALDFFGKIKAKTLYLTHLTHDLDHDETSAKLPSEIRLSYDGLEIDIEV